MCGGMCPWITAAAQAASWRAAVGPARTWVRSTTRNRASAAEAGRWGTRSESLGRAELAEHAGEDAFEQRGVGRLAQHDDVAQAEALRQIAARAFEDGFSLPVD